MINKRVSLARTILLWLGAAAGLAALSGCATVALSNLTPSSLPENPSQIYTFTLRAKPKTDAIARSSIAPHIVVGGQNYEMKPSPLGNDIYEFDYQMPAGQPSVAYYFLVDYQVEDNGTLTPGEANTGLQQTQIMHRYVLQLETNRGPVGASIGLLGRGFTPQDTLYFNGTAVRTVYASPTSLSFFVPSMPTGQNYQVTLGGAAGNSPVGTFRIDSTNLTVAPTALTLAPGETQTLNFTLSNRSRGRDCSLDVTTDVPESVIMPGSLVPAGQTSVSVSVQGGKPGTGSLVLKGYGGGDVTVPITVSGK